MIGSTILHYKILHKLGEGGMGVVYKALDTKLDRAVAIKFLPRSIAANAEERERFKIEARAAAALNHPNIATIHYIEDVDDETFLVMEFIEGDELKHVIENNPGGLPIDDVLRFAIQIADGLSEAHESHIIHRDIKSANIIINSKKQAKIMDFGLAKVRGGVQVTKAGTTLGTAAYMSPEQARGEKTDHRADIWSFGVVIYEMLTGKLPFGGDYEQAVIYSILNEEPKPVSELRPGIPAKLAQITQKALNKNADDRYQDIHAVLHNLGEINQAQTLGQGTAAARHTVQSAPASRPDSKSAMVAIIALILVVAAFFATRNIFFSESGPTSTAHKRIVVLPFQNLGPAEQEYFADGVAGEITGRLSGLTGLGVIARSSAMLYKNSEKSLEQIGNELDVEYVLDGTIQWETQNDGGRRVRVNPELIRIRDATQIWSRAYEADFTGIFALQADIATQVVQALDITLVRAEQKSLAGKLTNNSEAYDFYLRGIELADDLTEEKDLRSAEHMFRQAIELDPGFAEAYARLSIVQSDMYWMFFERGEGQLTRCKENAEQALVLDPDLSQAHVAMGNYHYHGKLSYEPALREFEKALDLNPNNIEALEGMAAVFRRQGRMEQSANVFERALAVDPRNFAIATEAGGTYVLLGQFDRARELFEQANILAPGSTQAYYHNALTHLLESGNSAMAREILEKALARKTGMGSSEFRSALYFCDIIDGKFAQALEFVSGAGAIDTQFLFVPEELLKAEIHGFMRNEAAARDHFQKASWMIKTRIQESPDDSRLHSALGIAYAGLGLDPDAIDEGRLGLKLLPVSREAWRGSYRLYDLAKIFMMVGEADSSIKRLDELLILPTDATSAALLKVDPTWDSLRENSAFQALLEKYSGGN